MKFQKHKKLLHSITSVFKSSGEAYGSPRVFKKLRAEGIKVSQSTIERVMRANGLRAKKRRKYRTAGSTQSKDSAFPNLVARRFDRGYVNKVWLSDITYLPTKEGFTYLATVMDAHSRRIIGWSVDSNMETTLVLKALHQAMARTHKPKGVILHSDQGSQYGSQEYRTLLEANGFLQSMSRRGNCWDNAPMESFFDSLKTEHASYENYLNLTEVKQKLFEWIEIFYNRKRLHSSLGYMSPACFEEKTVAKAA